MKRLNFMFFLRFFLALLVVLEHCAKSIGNVVVNHFYGDPVFIFFVLSGYANLISWRGNPSFKNNLLFIFRRIGKIITLALIFVLSYSLVVGDFGIYDVKVTILDFIKDFIYPFIGKVDNRDFFSGGIFTIWSLLVEFWFYIYTSIIVLTIKSKKIFIMIVLLIIILPLIWGLFSNFSGMFDKNSYENAFGFYKNNRRYFNIFAIGTSYYFIGILIAYFEIKLSKVWTNFKLSKSIQLMLLLLTLIVPIFGRNSIWVIANIFGNINFFVYEFISMINITLVIILLSIISKSNDSILKIFDHKLFIYSGNLTLYIYLIHSIIWRYFVLHESVIKQTFLHTNSKIIYIFTFLSLTMVISILFEFIFEKRIDKLFKKLIFDNTNIFKLLK